jgi:fumarate reductase flavoprotein subunit
MLSKYMPEAAGMFYEGHVGNQGDAIRWGEALGASVRDMGSFQGFGAVCDPHGMHLSYPHITEGGFHVNRDGLRFSNENAGYSEQALCVYRQPGHVAWAIWDDRCEQVANKQHSHVLANEAGAIKRYDSVDAMAAAIGCPAGALAQTLAEVEACTRGERTDAFGRNFRGKPVLRAPYYFARIMGALTHTQGGLEIDTQGRVLRPDRSAFPNLFAGGGAARGLSGPADWGYLSGSGLLMATNMGRIAGEVAAAQALAARASSAGQR